MPGFRVGCYLGTPVQFFEGFPTHSWVPKEFTEERTRRVLQLENSKYGGKLW